MQKVTKFLLNNNENCINLSVISGDAKCVLENTHVQNFATGISCSSGGTLIMNNSIISKCGTGLEAGDASKVQMVSSKMVDSSDYAVILKTKIGKFANGEKKKIVSSFSELREFITYEVFFLICEISFIKLNLDFFADQSL